MLNPPTSSPFDSPSANSRRYLPQYNVILHRVAEQPLLTVVRGVQAVTRFAEAEASSRMWEAYHCGRAVLLATHLERAELYAEQFAARGLSVTLEPAG